MFYKTDSPHYLRDATTGGLININDTEYQNILAHRKRKKELEGYKEQVVSLQQQFDELKALLLKAKE